jgi:hypothetical protein
VLLRLLRSRAPSYLAAALVAGLVPVLAGCSGNKPPGRGEKLNLDGVVTVNGRPLKSGTITFVCENNDSCSTDVSNGKFTIERVTPGKVRVTLGPPEGTGGSDTGPKAGAGKAPPAGPAVDFATLKEKEYVVGADQFRIEVQFP